MYLFGAGRLIASPISSTGTLQSPVVFGTLQDVMIDFKVDIKELWGNRRWPEYAVDGKGSIDITAKAAKIFAAQFALAFGATTSQGGGYAQAADEAHVVPATPYQFNLSNTPATTLGLPLVTAVVSGVQVEYTVLTSGSAVAGQSCVLAGSQLTFAAGDTGITVLCTYFYSHTNANDFTISITNPLIASATYFQLAVMQQTNNAGNNTPSQLTIILNRCLSPGLKLDFKVDDFVIPDFNAKAFADGSNQIGYCYSVN